MSQPPPPAQRSSSLEPSPQPTRRPSSTRSSVKSSARSVSKSLKNAFTKRKGKSDSLRAAGLRNGSDYDIASQRSGSIGPESFISNQSITEEEPRVSEEVMLDSGDPTPLRGRSPSRKVLVGPPQASPPRRRSHSSPRDVIPITITSPLPQSSETFPDTEEELPKPTRGLSLQTKNIVPSMSFTPATPINGPSLPSSPEKLTKSILSHQRSWSKNLNNTSINKEEEKAKVITPSGSVGSGVWGSLVNAANKVSDTISSLTTQSNSFSQTLRSVSAVPTVHPPPDNTSQTSNEDTLHRPRSQTLPTSTIHHHEEIELPKQMAIETLGEGELSLKELGFESDIQPTSRDSSSSRPRSVQDEIRDGGHEQIDFSAKPLRHAGTDLPIPGDHQRNDSVGRSHRSLTIPASSAPTMHDIDKRLPLPTNGVRQPRRLSSLSKRGSVRRNESVASRGSSDIGTGDEVIRRARKRSSLLTNEGVATDSPKSRGAATPDASDDREHEDGLYIHGKDGKKRKVPITGFAVQSGKRNRDFHALFKSVEDSDYLIEDYACALSKEILVQGRMYVSEHYICFNSNIFGWVTNLVIAFNEVVGIEKRSTAVLFPNGIQITTLHAKYVFASFVGRDGTYDLLTSIWRLSHPDSRSPDDEYDSESETPSVPSYSDDEGSLSDADDMSLESNLSEEGGDDSSQAPKSQVPTPPSEKKGGDAEIPGSQGNEGPESHDKTECECGKDGHYDKIVIDEVIKAPLGKVWNSVFGENKEFMMSFLKDNQKVTDVQIGEWKNGENSKKERQVSYVKALNNPVGPKQTKCFIAEQVQKQDFQSSCVALTTTTTPDVPSGSSFQVMTKYCVMWAGGSSTRMLITSTIEWSKSSWIKGAIEKGASEGGVAVANALVAELRKKLEKGAAAGKPKAGKKKSSKRKRGEENKSEESEREAKKERTGVLGKVLIPAQDIGDVVAPVVRPLCSPTGIIAVLLVLVLFALIRVERTMRKLPAGAMSSKEPPRLNINFGPDERNLLWDWIDSRIEQVSKQEIDGKLIWNNLAMANGMVGEQKLDEIQDAIRTTEGKLNALKGIVEKRKVKGA